MSAHAMTEQGMTELAASALGIMGEWCPERAALIGMTAEPAGATYEWAPRRNTEDAMNLAIKMEIMVWREGDILWVDHKRNTLRPNADMYDEARRLILCAAARRGAPKHG